MPASRFTLPFVQPLSPSVELYPGGQLFFYASGTSTPLATYSDAGLTTPNSNPVVADGTGTFGNIFLQSLPYKVVLEDADGNAIWTADPVQTNSFDITANPSIVVSPTGNPTGNPPPPTLASLNVQANATSATDREFLVCIGLTSAIGMPLANGADKVALYAGVVGQSGTSDTWAANLLNEMAAGSGNYTAQGLEIDFNNNNVDVGANNFTPPTGYGLAVSGAGAFKSTSAILFSGPSSPIWYRGLLFANFCISDKTLEDQTHSTTVFLVNGIHSYGMDFATGETSVPLRIGQGQFIKARDHTNTLDLTIAEVDASGSPLTDNMIFSDTGIAAVFCNSIFAPFTTDATDIGTTENEWRNIYLKNNPIVSSDPAGKVDPKPLGDMTPIVMALSPWSYGRDVFDLVEGTEVQTVHETEWQEWDEETVVIEEGKPILTTVHRKREVPVYDEVPVTDKKTGLPVYVTIPAKAEVKSSLGIIVHPAKPEEQRLRMHRVPRMVTKAVPVKKHVSRASDERHFGFMAPDTKAVFDAHGYPTFGGYVAGTNGSHHERPEQKIPVLWKALQETIARVQELESKGRP